MTSDYMLNLEKLAGPDLAVVTYDQRGVGRSSSPPADPSSYTLEKYAEDLEAVREALGADSVHLFGHSWGGIVALRYATLYPEQVRSIILMGSGPPTREQNTTVPAGSRPAHHRIGPARDYFREPGTGQHPSREGLSASLFLGSELLVLGG